METMIITHTITLFTGIALGMYISSQVGEWIDKRSKQMLNYIIIGVLFMGLCDLLHIVVLYRNPKYNLGWRERLFCILLWPWGLYVLIKSYLDSYNREE